jgi:hypothetical protein
MDKMIRMHRPPLERQRAYDLCAAQVSRLDGPAVVFASAPSAQQFAQWLPEIETNLCANAQEMSASAAIWLDPAKNEGAQVLAQIEHVLRPGGVLCVIAQGWLARWLPSHQEYAPGSGSPANAAMIRRWLSQSQMKISACWGVLGPVSFIWGAVAGQAQRLARQDLADRCHFEMRERMVITGWQVRLSALVLILAMKG